MLNVSFSSRKIAEHERIAKLQVIHHKCFDASGKESAKSLKETTEQKWLLSGRDYCCVLRDEMRMLMRKARFCQDELSSLSCKQVRFSVLETSKWPE